MEAVYWGNASAPGWSKGSGEGPWVEDDRFKYPLEEVWLPTLIQVPEDRAVRTRMRVMLSRTGDHVEEIVAARKQGTSFGVKRISMDPHHASRLFVMGLFGYLNPSAYESLASSYCAASASTWARGSTTPPTRSATACCWQRPTLPALGAAGAAQGRRGW